LQGSTKLAMLTFKSIKKWESWCAFNNVLIHKCVFHFHKIWATRGKEALDPSLHFGSPNHELSFKLFFWFGPIGVPSKMMPCRLNHNLIRLGLGPLSKGLGTNLNLLTNRNAPFHWTLLLGPLSKVALRLISIINYVCLVCITKKCIMISCDINI
jgi:hypothetical protein